MALPIHVFSSGDVVRDVLDAITMFINDYETQIIYVFALIGVPMSVIAFVKKKSWEVIGAWMAVTLLVPTLLLSSRQDVEIIDASNPMNVYSVTNVPDIIAVPAYFTTYYMYAMTDAVEGIFHTNSDEAYSRTGMLFGSSLFGQVFKAQIQNPELQSAWTSYVTNCIRPDIDINYKYTYGQLEKSKDILTFLADHNPSPLRGIYFNTDSGRTFATCKSALPQITTMFNQDTQTFFSGLTTAFDANTSDIAKSSMQLQNSLSDLQTNLMNISQGSLELTKQIMAINGLKKGLVDANNRTDGTWQSAKAFMAAQTETQNLGFMTAAGLWAQKKVPLLHTILILLIMCSAPIALGVAMIPNMTTSVLKNYVKGYCMLASWPIVFSFINYIATLYLTSALSGLTDANGGITISNLSQASLKNLDAAAIAGWLMALTPVISRYLVAGGGQIIESSAMQFSGLMSSIAGGVSREVSTGNLSLGNTSMNNHSFDNISANKQDLASTMNYFGASASDPNGVVTTTYGNGHDVYNARSSISQLPMNLNNSDAQRSVLNQAVRDQTSVVHGLKAARSHSISETATELHRAASNLSSADSEGVGYKDDSSSSYARDLGSMSNIVNEYAKSHGTSDTSAWQEMLSTSVSGGAKIPIIGGVKAKAEGSKSWTQQEASATSNANRSSLQQQFNEKFSALQSDVRTDSTDHRNTSSHSSESSVSGQLNQLSSANKSYEEALNTQHSYELAASKASEHSLSVNENLDNEFQSYVEQTHSNYGANAFNGLTTKQILTGTNAEARDYRDHLAQNFFEQKFADFGQVKSSGGISLTPNESASLSENGNYTEWKGTEAVGNLYNQAHQAVSDSHSEVKQAIQHIAKDEGVHYDKLHETNTELGIDKSLINRNEALDNSEPPTEFES